MSLKEIKEDREEARQRRELSVVLKAHKKLPPSPNSVAALRTEVRSLGVVVRKLCEILGVDPGDLTPKGS